MLMWIIYSCDGGTDETKADIPTCEATKTSLIPNKDEEITEETPEETTVEIPEETKEEIPEETTEEIPEETTAEIPEETTEETPEETTVPVIVTVPTTVPVTVPVPTTVPNECPGTMHTKDITLDKGYVRINCQGGSIIVCKVRHRQTYDLRETKIKSPAYKRH